MKLRFPYHPFHLVTPSPFPILVAGALLISVVGFLRWIHGVRSFLLYLGLLTLSLVLVGWFSSIILESTFLGNHTLRVQSGLRLGMLLFIISEVFFFLSFFWAYLHCGLSPSVELGSMWPPKGISSVSPSHLPLLNTVLLVTSGLTVTWSHNALRSGTYTSTMVGLSFTIFLGSLFTLIQGLEYSLCSFSIADSAYGSCFYLATGFHGLHVIIGSLLLLVCFLRLFDFHFSPLRHLSFEFAIWYWHFIDVIWLLLFLIFYCWGH